MERDTQLDTARCSGQASIALKQRLINLAGAALIVAGAFVADKVSAQCLQTTSEATVRTLYDQHRWEEAIAAAGAGSPHSADVNFDLGMSFAHLGRWPEARAALLKGLRQCPSEKRFATELAGVAYQQKRYAESTRWIRKALRLDPRDDYANDFAGTVYLLTGNVPAALKYWNRIQKPQIDSLKIDPQIHVQRLLLERAFVFSPQAKMRRADFESSVARVENLGVFPAFNVRLDARKDGKFDAEFHATERDGFGNGWLQSSLSVLSGLPYETVYPSYFNIGGSATNIDSLLRWDAQKRRLWVAFSGPWHVLPQWRWQLAADGRDENWVIRDSFAGSAPELASFKLKREVATGTITSTRSGRLAWTTGAEFSHRTYSNIAMGSALTEGLVSPGFELKHVASLRASLIEVPEHRVTVEGNVSSEFARLWSPAPRLFEKLQAGSVVRWMPQVEGDKYEFTQRVCGGGIAGAAPVDELWMIGVERDNDLWLRGHVGTRGGRKGSSPLADRYVLSNTDFYRSVWGNGLIDVKLGPWLDLARTSAPTSGLATRRMLVDAGAELKLSVLGTSVVLTYGRDLRNGTNAFYGSAMQK